MLGAVFAVELLRAGRRGRGRGLRWLYAAWLVLWFVSAYNVYHDAIFYPRPNTPPPADATARFATDVADFFLAQHFLLLVLVTPAFVAGAVTDEKTRGTLQYLLTAHAGGPALLVGKLVGRTVPVFVLGLTPLPLLAFLGPFGAVGPPLLFTWLWLTVVILFGLGAASLLASVWTRSTRDATLLVYLVGGIGAFLVRYGPGLAARLAPLARVADWLDPYNPLTALAAAREPVLWPALLRHLAAATAAWGGLGVVCLGLAIWRLRPAYLRQLEARPARRWGLKRFVHRPRLRGDPLAWKERYVGRVLPTWLRLGLVAGLSAAWTWLALPPTSGVVAGTVDSVLTPLGMVVLVLATLLVGVRASGCVTGERERQTWDALLMTPLSARQLVSGKLAGVVAGVWPPVIAAYYGATLALAVHVHPQRAWWLIPLAALIAIACTAGLRRWTPLPAALVPALPAVGVSALAGAGLLVVTPVGLLITWMTLRFLGAVGVWNSARSASSWRSLLATLVIGYAGACVLTCISLPIGCASAAVLSVVTSIVELGFKELMLSVPSVPWAEMVPVFMVAGTCFALWRATEGRLRAAEDQIVKYDRIPVGPARLLDLDLSLYPREPDKPPPRRRPPGRRRLPLD